MQFRIDNASDRPVYLQIIDQIKRDIALGRLLRDERHLRLRPRRDRRPVSGGERRAPPLPAAYLRDAGAYCGFLTGLLTVATPRPHPGVGLEAVAGVECPEASAGAPGTC